MKRSTMIKILDECINSDLPDELKFSYHRLSGILKNLEIEGMLPPKPGPIRSGEFYTQCSYFNHCDKGLDRTCGGCNGPEERVVNGWEREDLGPHKILSAEDYDALMEDLLSDGQCPCGSTSSKGCSQQGCPLYLKELEDEKK